MINLKKGFPKNPITSFPKLELGQKVVIKSLDWYNSNKNEHTGIVELMTDFFVEDMSEYCGKTATIVDVFKDVNGEDSSNIMYYIDLDNGDWNWTYEMFEPEMFEPEGVEDVKDSEE